MAFTSLPFLLFFAGFFLLYWLVPGNKGQNFLLLAGNYFFYAWGGNWTFLLLLIASSMAVFGLGIAAGRSTKGKNAYIWVGIGLTLGCLIYFKYFHSFLPLGLSFYTFKVMSYLFDLKYEKIEPTTDWLAFLGYISFFPCIVAGPIDRPEAFIPQLQKRRIFRYAEATDGMRQILWGAFKKIVIADNAAGYSADIFHHHAALPASALWYGAFLTIISLYADFSGYSDLAIGLGRLLGFNVTRNFNNPFFARNIAEFWRRWHISLTSWMTDYVFKPLSLSLRAFGNAGLTVAILVNFLLIGVWHGTNWTFVVFGLVHGCLYIPLLFRGATGSKGNAVIKRIATFTGVMLTMILFRSENLGQAGAYYRELFSPTLFSPFFIFEKINTIAMMIAIGVMFTVEWFQKDKRHPLQIDFIPAPSIRVLVYCTLILFILVFSPTKNADFIYGKF
jgi:alginate O-acetyltransferase complex protein AlgI